MKVEAPKAKTDAQRQLVEGAMRLRYAVLLTKAKAMMEHTVGMARRTGENSNWVERADQARLDIEKAEAAEQAAIDKLPYTRAELQAALDRLAKGQTPSDSALWTPLQGSWGLRRAPGTPRDARPHAVKWCSRGPRSSLEHRARTR